MFEIVEDKILYQATTRDYKVGDIIHFGKDRNYQARRVYEKRFKMPNGVSAGEYVEQLIAKKKRLNLKDMKIIMEMLYDSQFCLRELGMEKCRKLYYPNLPSRLKGMFLCQKADEAKGYLTTAQCKGKTTDPKVVGVKLNGKLLKTSNHFNIRDGKSIDDFVEQAHNYWKGVDENFNEKSVEYLFEGTAEVVEIIRY